MAQFGVNVQRDGWERFTVPAATGYTSPATVFVEGDASSASYFLAAGALGGGPLRVQGVGANSIQGDLAFADALAEIGVTITKGENWIEASAPSLPLKAFDRDFNHIPDAAMTLAVVALFCDGPSRLTNIASWRVKETDRIAAMATELRKLGAIVEEGEDWLRIAPVEKLIPNAAIDTYDDHRMAMCFSLASFGGVPVRINDPKCTAKTFPTYFDVFASVVK
jgi:3-phosphoshikimate 1-carboxyvinyltransferase